MRPSIFVVTTTPCPRLPHLKYYRNNTMRVTFSPASIIPDFARRNEAGITRTRQNCLLKTRQAAVQSANHFLYLQIRGQDHRIQQQQNQNHTTTKVYNQGLRTTYTAIITFFLDVYIGQFFRIRTRRRF
ncbi:unnamed protein product [Ectocarpus sp. 12 AP-2014]